VSVFLDIRVDRRDAAAAMQATIDYAWLQVSRILVDPAPPAAGPEAELTIVIDGVIGKTAASSIVDAITAAGVSVLAWRCREWERP